MAARSPVRDKEKKRKGCVMEPENHLEESMKTAVIHPTAIVEPGAIVADGVTIGPFSIIGRNVKIGRNSTIHAHALIQGWTEIGEENVIFPFASLGDAPQDLKYKGEETRLVIGDKNIFRECVTVHRGTQGGGGVTRIGSRCLFMAYCHVAHDCHIHDGVIMANSASLAGHVEIEEGAVLGGLVGVHQFVRIGKFTMVGAGSMISKDAPPYVNIAGNRDVLIHGLNLLGLKRREFNEETLKKIKKAYRILFRSNLIVSKALEEIAKEIKDSSEVDHLTAFVKASERGIYR